MGSSLWPTSRHSPSRVLQPGRRLGLQQLRHRIGGHQRTGLAVRISHGLVPRRGVLGYTPHGGRYGASIRSCAWRSN